MKLKTVIFSFFLLGYALLWGGILEVCRACVYFYFSIKGIPLPELSEFFLRTCYSTNGFSSFHTYVEVMLVPFLVSLLLIFRLHKSSSGSSAGISPMEILLYCFCVETLLGMFLLLIFILPLSGVFFPEVLNPPEMQTPIAVIVHYAFLLLVVAVPLTFLLWRIKK